MFEREYLDDCLDQLRKLKTQAEKAIAQVDDDQFAALIDPDANSIALIVKHLAGNMRSRWTGFLVSDGEKPGRNRDSEFELDAVDTRAALMARWDEGWRLLMDAVGALQPDDLRRTVTIRQEPQSVITAINRQLTHYAGHVGQIVLLAKHLTGPRWKTLTIPKAKRS